MRGCGEVLVVRFWLFCVWLWLVVRLLWLVILVYLMMVFW